MEYVRRAEELTAEVLDELDLSPERRERLKREHCGRPYTELVIWGRRLALNPKFDKFLEQQQEIVYALDKAGFIRHDLYRTLKIAMLYNAIDREGSDESWRKGRVCKGRDEAPIIQSFAFNTERYETTAPVTDGQWRQIMDVLYSMRDRKREVIVYRFCLDDDGEKDTIFCPRLRTLTEIGEIIGLTKATVGSHFEGALRMLCNLKKRGELQLPDLFGDPDPDAENEQSATQSLNERASEDNRSITQLLDGRVSEKVLFCLKQVGIEDTQDVLNCPKEKWFKDDFLKMLTIWEVLEIEKTTQYITGRQDFKILS